MSMEGQPDRPHPRARQIPEVLDLSSRPEYEEITVGDLEMVRNEINFKLAMLLNLQLRTLNDGVERTRAAMTPEEQLEMAREIGYRNFYDFVKWRQSQKAEAPDDEPGHKRRPDVPW